MAIDKPDLSSQLRWREEKNHTNSKVIKH